MEHQQKNRRPTAELIAEHSLSAAKVLAKHTAIAVDKAVDLTGAVVLKSTSLGFGAVENIANSIHKRSFRRRYQQTTPRRKLFNQLITRASDVTATIAEKGGEISHHLDNKPRSRRAFGALALGSVAAYYSNAGTSEKPKPSTPQLPNFPEPPVPPSSLESDFKLFRLVELYDWRHAAQAEYLHSQVEKILSLHPASEERANLEYAVFDHLKDKLNSGAASHRDVLLALEFSATIKGRNYGMELIWQGRQAGVLEQYGLKKLDPERIKWAQENQIDPRILAIAGDVRGMVLQILLADPLQFLEQGIKPPEDWTEEDKTAVQNLIPSAGMIAKLMMTETQGMLNLGTDWAIKQLNPKVFPSGPADLAEIAANLTKLTGFPFTPDNIPGSIRGDERYNLSGGAIGCQFMPILWRVFELKYNFVNNKRKHKFPPLSPFDPIMATMMATLYLSSYFNHREGLRNGQWVRDETTLRIGYNDEFLEPFLKYPSLLDEERNSNRPWASRSKLYQVCYKWNPWHPQIIQVIESAISYAKAFR